MKIKLLNHTPLSVVDTAVGKCWDTGCKDNPADRDKRIDRVVNKNKHGSIAEHLVYSFDIDGISRGCLQELARHRIASPSVKSTRYTLKELRDAPESSLKDFLVEVDPYILEGNIRALRYLKRLLIEGMANDKAKYLLPEAYKTSLVWTINARSLQNFLSLRTDKSALWEIQELAREIYSKIPPTHQFLFKDYVKEKR